jgi:hypothetical protein
MGMNGAHDWRNYETCECGEPGCGSYLGRRQTQSLGPIDMLRARVVEMQESELEYLKALTDTALYDYPTGQIEAFRRVLDVIAEIVEHDS